MSIGIPYAPTEVTPDGLIHICPVCGEKCIDPIESFDEYGEQTAPSAYQNHYAEKHAPMTCADCGLEVEIHDSGVCDSCEMQRRYDEVSA